MFTIDLLKGQGVPMKSNPGGIAIASITIVVPLIVAIIMFVFYLNDKITISIKGQEISRCQAEIDNLSDAVELQESLEKEKIACGVRLLEVKSSINRYIQWSPLLVTLVENMPNSVVLTGLEAKQHTVRKKVPTQDNPQVMIEKNVPVRILRMSVSGSPQYNCDKAVRDFRDSLRSSAFLGPKLDNIGVSQESRTLKGQDIASYDIDCVFKASL